MAIVKSEAPLNVDFFIPDSNKIHPSWVEWFNNIDKVTGGVAGLGDLSTTDVADLDGNAITISGTSLNVDIANESEVVPSFSDELLLADVSDSDNLKKATVENLLLQAGGVLQITSASSAEQPDITTVIPVDDTIPQIDEGDEILSLIFTPRSPSSTLFILVNTFASLSSYGDSMALFLGTQADAIASTTAHGYFDGASNTVGSLTIMHTITGYAFTDLLFTVRAGPGNVAGTTGILDHYAAGPFGGGSASTNMWIVEYDQQFT